MRDKQNKIYIDNDYAPETNRRRSSLMPVVRELRKVDPCAHLRGDKIFSRGRLFSYRQLQDLPIDPHVACTESRGEITLFSGTFSKLSNLYLHPFTMEDREWHSVEHVYQHRKAVRAGDTQGARNILMTSDPVEAMILGKGINAGPTWEQEGPKVMKKAQLAKFSLPPMKLALMNTKKIIGEATRNEFWGIGTNRGSRDSFSFESWKGKNIAGQIIMEVKAELSGKK